MNPIQFYTSVDVTLSEKLLEVMYCLIGLISIYVAFKNLKDKENKNSVGSFVFWFDLGVMFVLGKWLPALADGILLIILVLPPILKKVSPGNEPEPTLDEMEQNNKKIGAKVFVPAVCIGLFALLAAFFTKISPLVGMSVGVFVAMIILRIYSKSNTPSVFLKDCRRMMDVVGPLSLLPMLLAALGAVFTAAGVGDVISSLVSNIIPAGNVTIGIIVYAIGMAVFTMIMGNAFAAITVMTVGIGTPFVLKYGADPEVIGSLAITCGYCGTLCTPMAANFNMVPVAILEMKDKNGVIKKQVLVAVIMLVVQIVMMIMMS